jgi:hypothetical protein
MKKRGYNLTPYSYADEILTLAKDLKEFHSIHSHVVFYVPPKDAAEFSKFKSWFLFMNDHYLLSGMEEGLHRNTEELLSDGSPIIASVQDQHNGLGKLKNFSEIGTTSTKWYNIGLRGMIYGKSIDPELVKVGLEGRDFSRKENVILNFVERVSHSVSIRKWTKLPPKFQYPKVTILSAKEIAPVFADKTGVGLEALKRLEKIYPEFTIPMNTFENLPILAISDDGVSVAAKLSDLRVAEIRKAREKYVGEI